MRTSIILARKHGEKKFSLLADPSVSITEQKNDIREMLCAGGVHKEFAEVQIWDSTHGMQRTVKFQSPEGAKAEDDRISRENKAQTDATVKAEKKTAKVQLKATETPAPVQGKPVQDL